MKLFRFIVSSVILGTMLANSAQGAASASVTLAWNPSPGSAIVGYHLYVGPNSQNYTNMYDTGSSTNCTVQGLIVGNTYTFAVTAYDITGLESPFSTPITYTIPASTPTGPRIQLKMSASKQPTLSGTAPAGYVYNVQGSTDLKMWTTLGSVTASALGTISYTAPATTNKTMYYRLQQASTPNVPVIHLKLSASKQPTLSGTAPAGYVYNVLGSQNLKAWTTLGSVMASTSGTISYTASATTNKTMYYRLQQTSP